MKKIAQYFMARILPAAINLLSIIVVSEAYGNQEYGLYNLVFSSVVVTKTFISNWYPQYVLRFFYDESIEIRKNSLHYLLSTAIISSIILSVIYIVIFGLESGYIPLIFAIGILFLEAFMEYGLVLRRVNFDAKRYGVALVGRALIFLLTAIALARFQSAIAILAAMFLAVAIGAYLSKPWTNMTRSSQRPKLSASLPALRYGTVSALSSASIVITAFILKSTLEYKGDRFTLGAFSVINDISQNVIVITTLVVVLYFHPKILKLKHDGSEYNFTFSKMSYALFATSILIVVASYIFTVIYASLNIELDSLSLHYLSPAISIIYVTLAVKINLVDFAFQVRRDMMPVFISLLALLVMLLLAVYLFNHLPIEQLLWVVAVVVVFATVLQAIWLKTTGRNHESAI